MGEKTGVFGGSFNPVHKGHLAVACGVLKAGLVDEVWFMPCRQNPLKEGEPEFSADERVSLIEDMIDKGADSLDFFEVDMKKKLRITDVDLRLPSPSYTWKSLRQLTLENPDRRFCLIMGADSYEDFRRWKRHDWIRENFGLIIYPRPGHKIEVLEENCMMLENVKEYDISSTDIRNRTSFNKKY